MRKKELGIEVEGEWRKSDDASHELQLCRFAKFLKDGEDLSDRVSEEGGDDEIRKRDQERQGSRNTQGFQRRRERYLGDEKGEQGGCSFAGVGGK